MVTIKSFTDLDGYAKVKGFYDVWTNLDEYLDIFKYKVPKLEEMSAAKPKGLLARIISKIIRQKSPKLNHALHYLLVITSSDPMTISDFAKTFFLIHLMVTKKNIRPNDIWSKYSKELSYQLEEFLTKAAQHYYESVEKRNIHVTHLYSAYLMFRVFPQLNTKEYRALLEDALEHAYTTCFGEDKYISEIKNFLKK